METLEKEPEIETKLEPETETPEIAPDAVKTEPMEAEENTAEVKTEPVEGETLTAEVKTEAMEAEENTAEVKTEPNEEEPNKVPELKIEPPSELNDLNQSLENLTADAGVNVQPAFPTLSTASIKINITSQVFD